MKKVIIALVGGFLYLGGHYLYAVDQPHSVGTSAVSFQSQTLAQIVASTATTVGQVKYCSNCTQSYLCVSTGTSVFNQWATIGSSATTVGVCK